MPQSFSLGPVLFHFYGLFLGLGLVASYWYSSRNAKKFNLRQKNIDLCFLFVIFLALIGARFYHVADKLEYYKSHFGEIFSLANGGLGIFGALGFGLWGLFLAAKLQKISFFAVANLIFPSLLLAQAIGRIGNFFNLEAYGAPTNLPWKVIVNGEGVHPTFFYESVLCLTAFIVYLFLLKKKNFKDFGFAYYLISYGAIRLFTEFFRTDTWMINGVKLGWLFSTTMLIAGLFFFLKKKKKIHKI